VAIAELQPQGTDPAKNGAAKAEGRVSAIAQK